MLEASVTYTDKAGETVTRTGREIFEDVDVAAASERAEAAAARMTGARATEAAGEIGMIRLSAPVIERRGAVSTFAERSARPAARSSASAINSRIEAMIGPASYVRSTGGRGGKVSIVSPAIDDGSIVPVPPEYDISIPPPYTPPSISRGPGDTPPPKPSSKPSRVRSPEASMYAQESTYRKVRLNIDSEENNIKRKSRKAGTGEKFRNPLATPEELMGIVGMTPGASRTSSKRLEDKIMKGKI
jgi:hypothetical protein